MRRNMGIWDRALRIVVATPVFWALGVMVGNGSVGSVVLYALAAIMLITGLTGYCPLYRLFGDRTTVGCAFCARAEREHAMR
ncbi:hypothetical protein Afer_1022 [Acidimicrobium ferrooxidans DSM 10331]|uniref:Inner membrane protein YgaP-like transmembrane domain-containing protein n=1 Tax=Acidimicrobium ferrooxidans (strain DSM 10331 / JCM 15462 / NBRC 103882 / ICP) TaxID=525909 RepID=C7LZ02_ACIFD|nr:DUF2892 domain-containing protein [Acidimicrobium ferrooxidans]ACU53960.1 hypothetical protein Afer_1022 [Acidimicrobium ferrooxidans DSM 10331]